MPTDIVVEYGHFEIKMISVTAYSLEELLYLSAGDTKWE